MFFSVSLKPTDPQSVFFFQMTVRLPYRIIRYSLIVSVGVGKIVNSFGTSWGGISVVEADFVVVGSVVDEVIPFLLKKLSNASCKTRNPNSLRTADNDKKKMNVNDYFHSPENCLPFFGPIFQCRFWLKSDQRWPKKSSFISSSLGNSLSWTPVP